MQQAGFTVLTAYDGEEALHVIRRDKPYLVVLDKRPLDLAPTELDAVVIDGRQTVAYTVRQ